MGNVSESAGASSANRTSLPAEVDQANQEINEAVKSVGTMFLHLRAGRKPRDGDDLGSGQPLEELPVVTSAPEETTAEAVDVGSPEISQDSAETDHLLPHDTMEEEELRPHVSTESSWHVPKVNMETTVVDLDLQESPTTQSPAVPPSQPVTVNFDIGSRKELIPPSPSAHEFQGRDPTAWAMPDNYDYLTPYDDTVTPTSDDYSTTADTFEEELTTTPPPRTFRPRFPSPFIPAKEEVPRVEVSSSGADCRLGYVRTNGTCRSQCDMLPSYCFNGGQCYVLDGIGVFCR
ncbi:hypothetical protein NFI96_004161 [Prochilodus magdalenae]|nr:hypothetical protein NFI96_004161 [Prochilodus magdalenae]